MSSMHTLKLSFALLAAMTLAACSSTPEKEAGAGGPAPSAASTGATSAAIGGAGLDESALYAGKPSQQNSVVYFDYDSFTVNEQYRIMLREHAAFLMANPQRKLTIEAHADERGSNEYNIALSEKRGNAVRDILLVQGVNPDQISVVAYGEEKPVCDQHNEECWSQNRRAELVYGSR